jgi:protein-glutamine gamma-glutamyltransferase
MSGTLFVLFPRLPRQWNVQGRRPGGEVMAGFSNRVRLGQHGGRIRDNPQVAFRVEFQDGAALDPADTYWRGRSFDRFDGEAWTRTPALIHRYPGSVEYGARWGTGVRRARIFGGPPGADVLFGSHAVLTVEPRSAIRVIREGTGDLRFRGSDVPVYTVRSTAAQPPAARLRERAAVPHPHAASYLQLPSLDGAVRRLADSLTAGQPTLLDSVLSVERFLATELEYSLDLPARSADATVEGFLFRRRAGHCEYFSTAMAVMLRSVGIPARNVTGFAGGEWNHFGSYLAVTGNQAHSWVEVWFGELGWIAFDPTPASREAITGAAAAGRWRWPLRFWLDGLEHRWSRWVLDYNLERQLGLFAGVGDFLSRGGGGRGTAAGTPARVPPWVAAAIAAALAGGLAWRVGRGRRTVRPAETRLYLALRRAYARAGLGGRGGPLEFAEGLGRAGAPGATAAEALVRVYVRRRFAPGGGRPGDLEAMRVALSSALRALGRARPPSRAIAGRRGNAHLSGGTEPRVPADAR